MTRDELGDRMKLYERLETERVFNPLVPIYARIDGRGFSRFTRGLERPFDERFSRAMIETTRHLVEHTHARIGYTQSDEISLCWAVDNPDSQVFFAGKVQKMTSVLAGMATAAFTRALLTGDLVSYAERLPHFDARVFQLPSRTEAANAFLWRELDATKNAVSMATQARHSHKSLQGKTTLEMRAMLAADGVEFEDFPDFFKRGTFLRRVTEERRLSETERMAISEPHRPQPSQTFLRSSVKVVTMPSFRTVTNREAVVFDGAAPQESSSCS